jgi:hypothetical protein
MEMCRRRQSSAGKLSQLLKCSRVIEIFFYRPEILHYLVLVQDFLGFEPIQIQCARQGEM